MHTIVNDHDQSGQVKIGHYDLPIEQLKQRPYDEEPCSSSSLVNGGVADTSVLGVSG